MHTEKLINAENQLHILIEISLFWSFVEINYKVDKSGCSVITKIRLFIRINNKYRWYHELYRPKYRRYSSFFYIIGKFFEFPII